MKTSLFEETSSTESIFLSRMLQVSENLKSPVSKKAAIKFELNALIGLRCVSVEGKINDLVEEIYHKLWSENERRVDSR